MTTFPAGVSPYSLPGMKKSDLPPVRPRSKWKTDEERFEAVLSLVIDYYDVSRSDFFSPTRKRESVDVRKVFSYLCYTYFRMRLTQIARFLDKDHTSIIHYVNSIKNVMNCYPNEAKEIQWLASKLF